MTSRPTPYTVYFAAQYSRHAEMLEHAAELQRDLPHIGIMSRWILGDHQLRSDNQASADHYQPLWAMEDFDDVTSADVLIAFSSAGSDPGRARGGRHVEFGVALGQSKPIILVGDVENVFHWLPWIVPVPTWSDALELLRTTPLEALVKLVRLGEQR